MEKMESSFELKSFQLLGRSNCPFQLPVHELRPSLELEFLNRTGYETRTVRVWDDPE